MSFLFFFFFFSGHFIAFFYIIILAIFMLHTNLQSYGIFYTKDCHRSLIFLLVCKEMISFQNCTFWLWSCPDTDCYNLDFFCKWESVDFWQASIRFFSLSYSVVDALCTTFPKYWMSHLVPFTPGLAAECSTRVKADPVTWAWGRPALLLVLPT